MANLPSIPSRTEVIDAHKQAGGQVAAIFPIHYPRGLFRAFDLLPVEIWGPPGTKTTRADAHVQRYVCSIVRCGLSFLLEGGLDVAKVIAVPHNCDSLQGLGSILLDFIKPDQPVIPLYLPRAEDAAAHGFLASELRDVFDKLVEATGLEPSHERLLECTAVEERADARLGTLLKRRLELDLSDSDFYKLVRSREYLPAEGFIEVADAVLEQAGDGCDRGVRIVLSGIVPEPRSVLDAISEAGGIVAADDLACCGRRVYPPGASKDPFQRMAERLLGGPPDCMRGSAVADRISHLEGLVEGTGSKAVVFFEPSFCEPELFYLPQQRKALEASGVRTLTLETDVGEPLSEQLVTRLEALLETV